VNEETVLQVSVNGEPQGVPADITVRELLDRLEITGGRVAVERNLEIVPKATFETCRLAEGDRLEIVTLVGGG
jgi:thiamine biosynthesis protein ThiS